MLPSPSARRARLLKNVGLFCLLSGFALELGGAITGYGAVFKVGLFFFLLGIPLLATGIILGRRNP